MRQTGKTISLEAAKLLGIPFVLGNWNPAYKFVHGERGLELWGRWRDDSEWLPVFSVKVDEVFRNETALHVVEFLDDELEASDAPDR